MSDESAQTTPGPFARSLIWERGGIRGPSTVPNPCHSRLSTVRYGINAPHTQVSRYKDYFSCVCDLYDGALFARLRYFRGVRFSWSQENLLYLESPIGTVLVKSEQCSHHEQISVYARQCLPVQELLVLGF